MPGLATFGSAAGIVISFDDAGGWGVIDAGGEQFPFHCTQLLDGSRSIAERTRVTFAKTAGRMGRIEASEIRPAP